MNRSRGGAQRRTKVVASTNRTTSLGSASNSSTSKPLAKDSSSSSSSSSLSFKIILLKYVIPLGILIGAYIDEPRRNFYHTVSGIIVGVSMLLFSPSSELLTWHRFYRPISRLWIPFLGAQWFFVERHGHPTGGDIWKHPPSPTAWGAWWGEYWYQTATLFFFISNYLVPKTLSDAEINAKARSDPKRKKRLLRQRYFIKTFADKATTFFKEAYAFKCFLQLFHGILAHRTNGTCIFWLGQALTEVWIPNARWTCWILEKLTFGRVKKVGPRGIALLTIAFNVSKIFRQLGYKWFVHWSGVVILESIFPYY